MVRSAGIAATAITIGLVAGPADADTTYDVAPGGFTASGEGWVQEKGECVLTIGTARSEDPACRAETRHDATSGSPAPGSLETALEAVGQIGPSQLPIALTGSSVVVSPPFAVDAAGAPSFVTNLRAFTQAGLERAVTIAKVELIRAADKGVVLSAERTFRSDAVPPDPRQDGVWGPLTTTGTTPVPAGQYRLRITTSFASNVGQGFFQRQALGIDAPAVTVEDDRATSVQTLAPTDVTLTAATLRSRIVSDDDVPTAVAYELRRAGGAETRTFAGPSVPAATTAEPNAVRAEGLAECTDYEFRAVGTTATGAKRGDLVTFTTKCPSDRGAAGATGPAGGSGQGVAGSSTTVVVGGAGDARRLLRIDARRITVRTSGRWRGRGRVRIFCRRSTIRLCSGIVKVRTIDKINPASRGTRPRRRVTFTDMEYQLPRGAVGYAIFQLNEQRLDLLKRLGSVRVSVSVSVLDANNNRQTLTRVARLRIGR